MLAAPPRLPALASMLAAPPRSSALMPPPLAPLLLPAVAPAAAGEVAANASAASGANGNAAGGANGNAASGPLAELRGVALPATPPESGGPERKATRPPPPGAPAPRALEEAPAGAAAAAQVGGSGSGSVSGSGSGAGAGAVAPTALELAAGPGAGPGPAAPLGRIVLDARGLAAGRGGGRPAGRLAVASWNRDQERASLPRPVPAAGSGLQADAWAKVKGKYAAKLIHPSKLSWRHMAAIGRGLRFAPAWPRGPLAPHERTAGSGSWLQAKAAAPAFPPGAGFGAAGGGGAAVDLRAAWGPVGDQLQVGSCTVNALCGVIRYLAGARLGVAFQASRLFLYAKERQLASPHQPLADTGSDACFGLSWVPNQPFCSESEWPFESAKLNVAPPEACDAAAQENRLAGAYDLMSGTLSPEQMVGNIQSALAQGVPVLLTLKVYSSFLSEAVAQTGFVPVPNTKTEKLEGGLIVTLVGHVPQSNQYILANCYTARWGMAGFAFLPGAYLTTTELTLEAIAFTHLSLAPRHTGADKPPLQGKLLPAEAGQQIAAALRASKGSVGRLHALAEAAALAARHASEAAQSVNRDADALERLVAPHV
jgi:hypothetical protein